LPRVFVKKKTNHFSSVADPHYFYDVPPLTAPGPAASSDPAPHSATLFITAIFYFHQTYCEAISRKISIVREG
jgi:hypothetical protein